VKIHALSSGTNRFCLFLGSRSNRAERISFDEVAEAHRRLEAGGLEGQLISLTLVPSKCWEIGVHVCSFSASVRSQLPFGDVATNLEVGPPPGDSNFGSSLGRST
jgi:hypothetical protein